MNKKIVLLFLLILCTFVVDNVYAKDTVNVSVKDIEVVEKNNTEIDGNLDFDGLELKSNVTFYDVGDYIKYKVILKNNDSKDYQIKDIIDNNSSESIVFEYDGMGKVIKKGKEESFIVTITYNKHITNDITRLSNNVYSENNDVKISLKLAEYFVLINPVTGRNYFIIIFSIVMILFGFDAVIRNKKLKTTAIIFLLLFSSIKVVNADENIVINITFRQDKQVKINFLDKNWRDIDTDDFTKIKFVKIDKDKDDAYDISEVKDRSIIEWVDNGILYIGSYHDVYAPLDSSYLFSKYVGSNTTSTQSLFFENVTEIDFNNSLMTNYVTNMEGMFCECKLLADIDVSNFDTSNVTNIVKMFYTCSSLINLDVSNFDTTNVTNLSAFVGVCSSLINLNLDNLNLRGGINNPFMFNCSSLIKLSCKNWKLPESFSYSNWVGGGSPFQEIDVSNWDLSQTKSLQNLFSDCPVKNIIGLDTWNTSTINNMSYMFSGCRNLEELDLSNFDTSSVTNMGYMFYGCSMITSLDLSTFNTTNVTNFGHMFGSCPFLKELNMSNFDFNSRASYFFSDFFASLKKINLTGAVISGSMEYMFGGLSTVEEIILVDVDTSNVTNMNSLFYSDRNLNTIKVSDDFIVTQVTTSSNMFYGCTSLIGGNGTVYDMNHIDKEYARIDESETPGYFTRG